MKARRGKRDKCDQSIASTPRFVSTQDDYDDDDDQTMTARSSSNRTVHDSRRQSYHKHKNDAPTGGIQALLPSVIGLAILVCGVMAKLGFRGRASVCGIDLGTTNSVVCVQAQTTTIRSSTTDTANSNANDVWIECISDPATGSPVIPSVVSFLDASERKVGPSSKVKSRLHPHPSHVVVGQAAKRRIDSHPHHTLYNAKRVLGRPGRDPAVVALATEVEFGVVVVDGDAVTTTADDDDAVDTSNVVFQVPDTPIPITPRLVGSYVINHLVRMTESVLGHANVKSAIICVPAKFNARQREETVAAVTNAGLVVTRIVEEPTAAALAYGLHRKTGVNYIMVYDFGGGTLDISLLHVSDGFVDVMGSDGDDRLGGTDFDVAIAHFLLLTDYHPLAEKENDPTSGREIVDGVGRVLQHIQRKQPSKLDVEDVLSIQCPKLKEIPLCTISSFHTLGEQLKIQLSNVYSLDQETAVTAECLGVPDDLGQRDHTDWTIETFCSALRPVPLVLRSSEFDRLVQPLLDRAIVPVTRLLADLDLAEADIDEIVMVGGTTRMPHIRRLVQEAFPNSQLNTRIDPDITVAYGAASVID